MRYQKFCFRHDTRTRFMTCFSCAGRSKSASRNSFTVCTSCFQRFCEQNVPSESQWFLNVLSVFRCLAEIEQNSCKLPTSTSSNGVALFGLFHASHGNSKPFWCCIYGDHFFSAKSPASPNFPWPNQSEKSVPNKWFQRYIVMGWLMGPHSIYIYTSSTD